MSIQEHVILVNDQGKVIGTQEKYAAHTSHTPLHLAFSSWLFNANGECLITRRALSKKPGPAYGPTPFAAIHRPTKRQSRRLSAAAALKSAPKSQTSLPLPRSSATVKPTRQGSLKTKSARSMPPA